MSQNTRYAKWDANSGATTFTQTDEPVGMPPSAQLPRPGPVKRFVQWLSAVALKRPRAWIADEVRAINRAERRTSLQDIVRAMEETRAATIESFTASAELPAEPAPPKNDDTVFQAIAASIEAARKWGARCPNCRRDVSEISPNTSRDVPEPPQSQGCAEKKPFSEGRPPPTEH